MTAVTLTTLRSRVRERADMPVAGFIADSATSLDAFINEGVQRLHEKLVSAYGDEYVSSTQALTIVAGTKDYALPTDFFKLYGVDIIHNGRTQTLRPFMRAQRNDFQHPYSSWAVVPKYTIRGSNLHLEPSPVATTGTLFYAPCAALLVQTSDAVNYPNGWERYVVMYAAIQCLIKEESDTGPLTSQLRLWEAELDAVAQDRDAAFPRNVVDVESISVWEPW